MSYLKYTPYVYLVLTVFFVYEAIVTWDDINANPALNLIIAALGLFMFFFRRKFVKRMEERKRKM